LETIRVGTGERNAARSAGLVRANSRLLKNPVIVASPWSAASQARQRRDRFRRMFVAGRERIFARAGPEVNVTTSLRADRSLAKPATGRRPARAIIALS
jgi:hypothetical protein